MSGSGIVCRRGGEIDCLDDMCIGTDVGSGSDRGNGAVKENRVTLD